MPVHSGYPTIDFVFNLTHLLHNLQLYLQREHSIVVDFHVVYIGLMAIHCSLLVLFRQMAEADVKRGGTGESLLLDLFQHQLMGHALVYFHLYHGSSFDEEDLTSPGTSVIIGLCGIIFMHSIIQRVQDSGEGLLSVSMSNRLRTYWNRYIFLLPSNPMSFFYYCMGYFGTRLVFPWSRGNSCALWSMEAGNSAFERPGGEICPYSWQNESKKLFSATGVRACNDLSLLCLIFAGLIWPCIEFGRLFIIKCSALYAPYTPAKKPSKPSSSRLVKRDADDDDDAASHESSGIDSWSSSFFASVMAFTNMFVLCMFATWAYSVAMMAQTYEYSTINSASTTSCLTPHQVTAYEREVSLLRNTSCAYQWSYLQNIQMFWYASCGLLAALFGTFPNPMPPMLRVQFFVILAMSLWKGGILPSCMNIGMDCFN